MMNTIDVNKPVWFDETLLCSTDELFYRYRDNVIGSGNTRRIFFDNNGHVLIVCHADTVCKPKFNDICEEIIFASGLDDRLGIMIAFYVLNKYNLKADLLITDNEEWAQSTAQFHSIKQYNWIIGFDRGGSDYVDYGLCAPSFHQIMQNILKVKTGFGSFSDISFLRTNASCINLGIGYYNAHSEDSYCKLFEVDLAIRRFLTLYKFYSKIAFKQLNTNGYKSFTMKQWSNDYSNLKWL